MGKRRLISGVVLGATVGGALALLDKDTREYAKTKLEASKVGCSYYLKHPAEAIENIRETVDKWNQNVTTGAENAINALEQVEETIDKFTNKG